MTGPVINLLIPVPEPLHFEQWALELHFLASLTQRMNAMPAVLTELFFLVSCAMSRVSESQSLHWVTTHWVTFWVTALSCILSCLIFQPTSLNVECRFALNDDRWHTLHVKRRAHYLEAYVDSCTKSRGNVCLKPAFAHYSSLSHITITIVWFLSDLDCENPMFYKSVICDWFAFT